MTVWPGPVPARREGEPPSAEYLATRERLGFPSQPLALVIGCAWCAAGTHEMCRVRGTGQRLPQPHQARPVPCLTRLILL